MILAQTPPMYPVPPSDISASTGPSVVFLVICGIVMTMAVVWVARLAKRGETLPAYFLVAGLLMGTLEPYFDYLGLLWFADDNVAVAVNLFGRHIPLYVVLGYSFFFGLQSFIMYRAVGMGKPRKFFVYAYAVAWVLDFALQGVGRALGLYEYYGRQPLMIFDVPAWWFTIDALLPILAGFVFFGLRERLVGWGRLLIIPIVPALYAALNGAVGVPVFTAINSNFDASVNGNATTALVWSGGLLTVGLVLLFAWLIINEIHRMQLRAGIQMETTTTVWDVLSTKAGANPPPRPRTTQHA